MAELQVGNYRLTRKIIPGDAKRGIPDLWRAEDLGDIYFAKVWPKGTDNSSAIQALWNREVRSLMRLQGYPGASELFVKLRDLDSDDKNYFAILDGGRRQILGEYLKNRSKHQWLLNLAEVGRRRPLWEGMLRVAQALIILHREGTLHRSVSPQAIFASPDGQGDFRLSGFEWALRISGSDSGAAAVGRNMPFQAPELDRPDGEFSIATDWYDFGLTAAEIFGLPIRNLKKRSALEGAINSLTNLREREREFIHRLLEEVQEKRLVDADEIEFQLRGIIRDLGSVTVATTRDLVLAVRLNSDLEISKTIELVSEGKAPTNDPVKQRDWIKYDLRGDPRVVARNGASPFYVIKGEKLEYRVRKWSEGGLETWDVAHCDMIERMPRVNPEDQIYSLGGRKIDVQLKPHVSKNLRTVRDRAVQWDRVFPFRVRENILPTDLRNVHDFFRVTQSLDTLLTVAQICAVEIISVEKDTNDTTIIVTPAHEPDRAELARLMGLESPAEQMVDWFKLGAEPVAADDEEDPKKDKYTLLERRTISGDPSPVTWKFVRAQTHPSGPRYHFRTQGAATVPEKNAYLARNHSGTIAQIRRRHKAIEDLRMFEGVLRMILSPEQASRTNSDLLPAARLHIPLDPSKAHALEKLWRTQPSFAVQGPPGTGKTTLIKAFVERLLTADPSAQILITAHSHHTVDDVRKKISELFLDRDGHETPITLRLGGPGDDVDSPETVTSGLLAQLNQSEMAKNAPDHLRTRLSAAVDRDFSRNRDAETELGAMQVLVQDAANLTFATLNSTGLADLAERGRRFDWSIIEEAGKAHGFDMATALQESHRLLLIGDHFQLPPFNVKRFSDLLGDPTRVRNAIQKGAQFAGGLVDQTVVADDDTLPDFVDRCQTWAGLIKIFEVIFTRSRETLGDAGPAAVLTDQHRMHPDIADLVGRVFYPEGSDGTILQSPKETHERFEQPTPFQIKPGSWLPSQRIVWCDVEWVQKEMYADGEVDGLFVSKPEVDLIVKVLKEIQPLSNTPCNIQILSPYNGQLEAIKAGIEKAYGSGQLLHMFKEPFDLKVAKRTGATVDEFQGSEADVVIVSLVRNNALIPWKSVGFLKEKNRMNVLLSRAKQKLVIVGSWDFFNSRCNKHTSEYDEHAYIGQMMKVMKASETAGILSKVRFK